jgi:WD40 repeat protein
MCSLQQFSDLSLAAELRGHRGCVNCLSWNPSGTRLASGSDDKNVIVWQMDSKFDVLKRLQTINTGHRANIFCVRFLGTSDEQLITGGADGQTRLHRLHSQSGWQSQLLERSRGAVKAVELSSQNSAIFYTASEDGKVRQYDTRVPHAGDNEHSGITIIDIGGLDSDSHKTPEAKAMSLSPVTGVHMLVGAGDQYVRLYDLRQLPPLRDSCLHRRRGFSTVHHTPNVLLYTPRMLQPELVRCDPPAVSMDGPITGHTQAWLTGKPPDIAGAANCTHVEFDSSGTEFLANYHILGCFSFSVNGVASVSSALDSDHFGTAMSLPSQLDVPVDLRIKNGSYGHRQPRALPICRPGSDTSIRLTSLSARNTSGLRFSTDMAAASLAHFATLRQLGNDAFRAGRLSDAITWYAAAVAEGYACLRCGGDATSVIEIVGFCLTNKALAHLKRQQLADGAEAVRCCTEALEFQTHFGGGELSSQPSFLWKAEVRMVSALRECYQIHTAVQEGETFLGKYESVSNDEIQTARTQMAKTIERMRKQLAKSGVLRTAADLPFKWEHASQTEEMAAREPRQAAILSETGDTSADEHVSSTDEDADTDTSESSDESNDHDDGDDADVEMPNSSDAETSAMSESESSSSGTATSSSSNSSHSSRDTEVTYPYGYLQYQDDSIDLDNSLSFYKHNSAATPLHRRSDGTGCRAFELLSVQHNMYYDGPTNCMTDIKEAVYWEPTRPIAAQRLRHAYLSSINMADVKSDDIPWSVRARVARLGKVSSYVLCGSDTGSVVVFDRKTGVSLGTLFADEDTVNCIRPHPTLPLLTSSGIDHTVKVWSAASARRIYSMGVPPVKRRANTSWTAAINEMTASKTSAELWLRMHRQHSMWL